MPERRPPPRLPSMRTSLARLFSSPPRRPCANITEVFRKLDGLAQGNFGSKGRTEVDDERLARAIAADGLWVVDSYEGKVDPEWYSRSLDEALAIASLLQPELSGDAEALARTVFDDARQARGVFMVALGVTSQGVPVQVNAAAALEQYRAFSRSGAFEPRSIGPAGQSMIGNLKRFGDLVDAADGDLDAVCDFLECDFTVGEIREHAARFGIHIALPGKASDPTYGSVVFGPKIGAFVANLMGRDDAVTIDMWLTRTFGRLTGENMAPAVPEATMIRLTEALGKAMREGDAHVAEILSGMSIDDIPTLDPVSLGSFARRAARIWNAEWRRISREHGGEAAAEAKGRLGWPFAVQGLEKYAALPVDSPSTESRRVWMRSVMRRAAQVMGEHGRPISVSGLQAALWYPEKQIVSMMTHRRDTSLNVSFADAFETIALAEGILPEIVADVRREAPDRRDPVPIDDATPVTVQAASAAPAPC